MIHVLLTSLGSIAALFILSKLVGYRQMSQMNMFDYITGITIGSIAAEMATSTGNDFIAPLTALGVYTVMAVFFAKLTDSSIVMRRFITGKPILLYMNEDLYFKNFKKAKIDIGEFLTQCRESGYFDISEIYAAILEPNGKISFLEKTENRPVTVKDLKIKEKQRKFYSNVIIDGNIMYENLNYIEKSEQWLYEKLQNRDVGDIKNIFLATCDLDGNLQIYIKNMALNTLNIFE